MAIKYTKLVDYNTELKNYKAFKILEANNKIIDMPDGDRIFDIRDFNKVIKNLDSWIMEFTRLDRFRGLNG